jgi:hypothetical protein
MYSSIGSRLKPTRIVSLSPPRHTTPKSITDYLITSCAHKGGGEEGNCDDVSINIYSREGPSEIIRKPKIIKVAVDLCHLHLASLNTQYGTRRL